MAGSDRGNMRCFEALGCGALMVSDTGNYPEGMEDGSTMLTYAGANDVKERIQDALNDLESSRSIAARGQALMRLQYSKDKQWAAFTDLVGRL